MTIKLISQVKLRSSLSIKNKKNLQPIDSLHMRITRENALTFEYIIMRANYDDCTTNEPVQFQNESNF